MSLMSNGPRITLSLAVALAGCAASEPHEIDPSSIKPLIEFVERETGYRLEPPPRILAAPPGLQERPNRHGPWGAAEKTNAFYFVAKTKDPADGQWSYAGVVVLDVEKFRASDLGQMSTLVHELVHHGQALAIFEAIKRSPQDMRELLSLVESKGWECRGSKEHEAYIVQNKWLSTHMPHRRISEQHITESSTCTAADRAKDDPRATELENRAVRVLTTFTEALDMDKLVSEFCGSPELAAARCKTLSVRALE